MILSASQIRPSNNIRTGLCVYNSTVILYTDTEADDGNTIKLRGYLSRYGSWTTITLKKKLFIYLECLIKKCHNLLWMYIWWTQWAHVNHITCIVVPPIYRTHSHQSIKHGTHWTGRIFSNSHFKPNRFWSIV